ncbi:hypothetical protein CAEBREN_31402 [Caenorhabditis brenneri]|uniref:SCP domain-containing protein n=1 Tax=Caenorhabditis brenneri TaxID=135651 RepID=G0N2S0_CAEBE|nr:hypothetical protein CAEBREN_31402 [Caenorhabditis brenneri]
MKVPLALICIFFCANRVFSKTEGGLSVEEQKKLLEMLNNDRREVSKKSQVSLDPLVYDDTLEKGINCGAKEGKDIYALMWNKLGDELQHMSDTPNLSIWGYFNPGHTTIGCSKKIVCTEEVKGKPQTFYGACRFGGVLGKPVPDEVKSAMEVNNWKYGELLKVENGRVDYQMEEESSTAAGAGAGAENQGSGSGKIFGFISLFIVMIWI